MATAELKRPVNRDAQFSYVLDCAVELGEVTPMEASVFMVDNHAALALSDSMDGAGTWSPHFLRNTARAYLDELKPKERWLYALKGLEGMDYALKALTERMEFVAQKKVQGDLGLDDEKPLPWLAEASAPDSFDGKLFESVHDINPDRVLQFLQPKFGHVRSLIEEDLNLAIEAMNWLQQPGARAEARELAKTLFRVESRPSSVRLPSGKVVRQVASDQKKLRNKARGAIKKALSLLSSFGMEKNVQVLVSGGTVTLSHPDSPFKLEVAPLHEGWLEQRTLNPGHSAPFRLSVVTTDGVFLSRLCVLFRDTPVLDQLLALSMYVQTGNMMEVLGTANWFGYEDAEMVRAVLTDKSPELLRKLPQPGRPSCGIGPLDNDEYRGMHTLHAHWEPFRGPVRTWLGEWFGPAAQTLRLLQDSAPRLALI